MWMRMRIVIIITIKHISSSVQLFLPLTKCVIYRRIDETFKNCIKFCPELQTRTLPRMIRIHFFVRFAIRMYCKTTTCLPILCSPMHFESSTFRIPLCHTHTHIVNCLNLFSSVLPVPPWHVAHKLISQKIYSFRSLESCKNSSGSWTATK